MTAEHPHAERLRNERESAVREIARLEAQLKEEIEPASATDDDSADAAADIYERGKIISLIDNLENKIHSLDRALEMVADGTYGICEKCGEAIPIERLQIMPETTLCVRCASERERGLRRYASARRRRDVDLYDEEEEVDTED
ncbi:MAG: TraR/DksA C4-type zinc finger protein [Anaerolineae bacterium]|jgi:RNA polymerase-binding transcription factor DksA